MKRVVCLLMLFFASPLSGQAHFLWLAPEPQGPTPRVQVHFGEAAEPDDPAFLEKVLKAEAWSIGGRGGPQPLVLTKTGDILAAPLTPAMATTPLILRHPYGVITKGGATFLLNYTAKAYPLPLPGTWKAVNDTARLPLEVTPSQSADSFALVVTWQGKPLAKAAVHVTGPGLAEPLEGTTDEAGRIVCTLSKSGTYSIRARHVEETAGELDGKAYTSIRHYSTLTLNYVLPSLTPTPTSWPALIRGTTSFGGAIVGQHLYVYGGNYGTAHEYANEDQSGDLWRLDLGSHGAWEKIATGPKLQGLAIVAHRGQLYRIGGFTAMNKTGETENLRSQADFARFDMAGNRWIDLPKLPEPRSSHDAALVGDTVYVVGGWNMQGGGNGAVWATTALACDLSAAVLEWKPIATPPFQRRALALAEHQGQLLCLGGMQEKGGPTTAVSIFNPAKNAWSDGPALLGGGMEGFGSSAFASGESLYATTMSGSIQRLRKNATAWEFAGQLAHPRFFHRVLPYQQDKLVIVGGSHMDVGKVDAVELLPLDRHATAKR